MAEVVAVDVPDDAVLDVVFLHGLDGDPRKSWTSVGDNGFWPGWVAEDVAGAAVWSVGYEAWSSKYRGDAMPMEDRTVNVLASLQVKGVGERPLVFVTHSMGGLIVKEALLYAAYGDTEFASFATMTRGVVFLGTPHNGSGLTTAVEALGKLYRGTAAVKDLRRNSAHLRQLSTRYQNWVHDETTGIRHLVFFETKPTKGVHVVDAGSANPALPKVQPVGVDVNHVDLCKPADRDTMVYGRIRNFIADIAEPLQLQLPVVEVADRYDVRVEVVRSEEGRVTVATTVGGVEWGSWAAGWPSEVGAWQRALRSPTGTAELLTLGHRLWDALFDKATGGRLVALIDGCPVGRVVEVVFSLEESLAWLPVELVRLPDGRLLAAAPGVSVRRELVGVVRELTVPLPGPLKILAAVAAPEETSTASAPLDVEAEMQALLDAVSDLDIPAAGAAGRAQVRILELASLEEIRRALSTDQYHVLHLSAHGSPVSLELEDEDGAAQPAGVAQIVAALKAGQRPLPLVMLSSCHGATQPTTTVNGASSTEGMDSAEGTAGLATALVRQGADRVIAMQASVTDTFATDLAREFYRLLIADPATTTGAALATARRVAADQAAVRARREGRIARPEDAVPVLVTAGADTPLRDPAAPATPLTRVTVAPTGTGVRELPIGHLIGRRRQTRAAIAVLRRSDRDRATIGAWNGAILTGIGGIGKTAVAGRVLARAREQGWLIAEHVGAWNPNALIASVIGALPPGHPIVTQLTDPTTGPDARLGLVFAAVRQTRLLVLFDDFEQNLTDNGEFTDIGFAELFTALCDTAQAGRILVTSRYPIPGSQDTLLRIDLPPLSSAESRRLFLRLPAIRDLDSEQQRVITRMIGGHPRLIEFLDVLLRHGTAAMFQHVTRKLRDLANEEGIDLTAPRDLTTALTETVRLGSRDIVLDTLYQQLTHEQRDLALHAALCRASATRTDLTIALHGATPTPEQQRQIRVDVERLRDLTLLTTVDTSPDSELAMHPWVADHLNDQHGALLALRHEHNATMRLHRINTGRGRVEDIIDLIRHAAGHGDYDTATGVALQTRDLGFGQAALAAILADAVPFIPTDHPNYLAVADLECEALENLGLISSTTDRRNALLATSQQQAAADPDNAAYQRNLSINHNKLGDLAMATGDTSTAHDHYQASLDIREALTAADPRNAEYQRDLSISHERLGDFAVATGDTSTAHDHYQAGLDIREALTAAHPDNAAYQRDLSINHNKLGDLAMATGDTSTAHSHYQADLDIAEALAAADPDNAGYKSDLTFVQSRFDALP